MPPSPFGLPTSAQTFEWLCGKVSVESPSLPSRIFNNSNSSPTHPTLLPDLNTADSSGSETDRRSTFETSSISNNDDLPSNDQLVNDTTLDQLPFSGDWNNTSIHSSTFGETAFGNTNSNCGNTNSNCGNTSSHCGNTIPNEGDFGSSNIGSTIFDDPFPNSMLSSSTFSNAPFDYTSFYSATYSPNGFLIGNPTPGTPIFNSNASDNFAFNNAAYNYAPLDSFPLGNLTGLHNEYIDPGNGIANQMESIPLGLPNVLHRAPRELYDISHQAAQNIASEFIQSYSVTPQSTRQILPGPGQLPSTEARITGETHSPSAPSPGLGLQESEELPSPPTDSFRIETKTLYICTISRCNKRYARVYDLRRHQQEKHEGRAEHQCRYGGCKMATRRYSRKDKRDDHERRVHGQHGRMK